MQNLHWATDDAFLASDAWSVGKCHGLATQSPSFDIDSHLAKLIANIAVDAFAFLGCDFKL